MSEPGSLFSGLRAWRLRGLTLYFRDPGVGSRYWHYRGHLPRLLSPFWCRWVGHHWHRWEGGFVYGGGYADSFSKCDRCEAKRR